jgi:hypothetical protein
MRRFVLATSVFFLSTGVVFAGKAHREAMKGFEPKAKEASAAIKSGCGCAPSMAWDAKAFDKTPGEKVDDYRKNVEKEFEDIAKTAKEFCSDAESKKIFCSKVKKVVVSTKTTGSDPDTKYANGTFTIVTTDQMASGGYGMKNEMEKW